MKEFIYRLTWVDYVALVAVLRGCYVGYKSGFFPELLRIAAYLLTIAVAFYFLEPLAQFLTVKTFLNFTTAKAISLFILLVGVFSLTKLLIMLFLKVLKAGEGGVFYRILGLLLGACRWVILLSFIFMLIDHSPLNNLRDDIQNRSWAGPEISRIAPMTLDFLSNALPNLSEFSAKSKTA